MCGTSVQLAHTHTHKHTRVHKRMLITTAGGDRDRSVGGDIDRSVGVFISRLSSVYTQPLPTYLVGEYGDNWGGGGR